MKKIAIIGANEFQDPLIRKAKEMGFETHVFAWEAGDIGERTADVFHPISIIEKQAIGEVCQQVGVEACCSIGSDLATHTVNYVQRRLGNPCNPEITDTIATNKYEMRRAFQAAGVPCPGFIQVDGAPAPDALSAMGYPMIVKPTDRSGSRGIFKVDDYRSLCQAVPQSIACSFEKQAIIEEFIQGNEYSCESISFAGKHHILALTKKYTTGAPHFIETGHCEPSDIPVSVQERVKTHIRAALDALHIQYGASHAEFKLTPDGDVRIIEIGARMGGDCIGSDLVYLSTGMDFMAMVIDTACGKAPDLTPVRTPTPARIRFLFSQADLDELNELRRTAPETIWRAQWDAEHLTADVTDSSNRHGYWITTDSPARDTIIN
jgi:biotin carboxylase